MHFFKIPGILADYHKQIISLVLKYKIKLKGWQVCCLKYLAAYKLYYYSHF